MKEKKKELIGYLLKMFPDIIEERNPLTHERVIYLIEPKMNV